MLWDILIVGGIGFTQIVITVYGVYVSVVENRMRTAIIIGIVGAIGMALTVWGAIRSGKAQQSLQAQLNTIQQNTERPQPAPVVNVTPQVNIPSAEPPSANVSMFSIWSIYQPGEPVFKANTPAKINLSFKNTGGATADRFRSGGRSYLIDKWDDKSERESIADFKKSKQPAIRKMSGVPMVSGSPREWMTTDGPVLTSDDIIALENGTKSIMLLAEADYSDPHGSHYVHYCSVVQAPAKTFNVVAHCKGFHDYK